MSTKTRLLSNLTKALWDSDLIATRIALAMGEFAWAVMLLWPGTTFDRPTYYMMSLIANEETWGFVLLLSCVTQLSIVIMGDFTSRFAKYFAAWNATAWIFIGVVSPLLSVSPPPAAMGGEMALACSALWVWIRPYFLAEAMYATGH